MGRVIVWPYKMGSKSARDLARELGALRVYSDRNYRPKSSDIVINWGNSHEPTWNIDKPLVIFNYPSRVRFTVNKINTFNYLHGRCIHTLPYTVNKDIAKQWLDEGSSVVCRTILTGHSGAGIVIVENGNLLPDAPLYTKLIAGDVDEYRVHIHSNPTTMFDYAQKKKRRETDVHPHIRTHDNGWVFCREGVTLPEMVQNVAVSAREALGLSFMNIDILYNRTTDTAYIIEINSAPALEGTTLARYVAMLQEKIYEITRN